MKVFSSIIKLLMFKELYYLVNTLDPIEQPCSDLTENQGKNFFYKNQKHLYLYPKSYFADPMVKQCKLRYIDLLKVEPYTNKSSLWISYMGDSLCREVFMGVVQRFTDYIPLNIEHWSSDESEPKMGYHMGPDFQRDVGGHYDAYHQEKLVCCQLNNPIQMQINNLQNKNPGSCIYAMHKNSTEPTRKEEIFKKYKLYLFDDIADYVNDFIDPLFLGKYKCISFTWAPRFTTAADVVINLHKHENNLPSAIIMNMALHEHKESDKGIDQLINTTDQLFLKYDTKFILHSGTYFNESLQRLVPNSSLTAKHLVWIDGYLRQRLPKWRSLNGRYLSLYNFTKKLHASKGCGAHDGIHFSALCNYQAFVQQWDFNWLNYLKVIYPQNNILVDHVNNTIIKKL